MIEVVRNSTETKMLTTKRPRDLAVIGCDLDVDLCSVLVSKDKVLMEINGSRTWSSQSNPLVAEEPWEVVSNELEKRQVSFFDRNDNRVNKTVLSGQLVLSHSRLKSPFVLDYKNLMNTGEGPAVFVEMNDEIKCGTTLFVILQMVGFYTPENTINKLYPPISMDGVDDALSDSRVKLEIFKQWSFGMRKFHDDDWGYWGIKRFALRAGVKVATVKSIRDGDLAACMQIPHDDIKRMWEECYWLPTLRKQGSYIMHDPEKIYQRVITGENV